MSNLLLVVFLALVVAALVALICKKREVTEANLGVKLVGFTLLGALTLQFNGFYLPLGGMLFFLSFRPTTNVKVKHYAVYLGLALSIIQLSIPRVETFLYELPRTVTGSSTNVYQLDFTYDWQAMRDQLNIAPDARLENFRVRYRSDGQINRLSYDLITRLHDEYIRYRVQFSSETSEYTIRQHKLGNEWLQFNRLLGAARFFEVLDTLPLQHLYREFPAETISVTSNGEIVSYAIKSKKKYLIQGQEIDEITNDQLPLRGYTLNACGYAAHPVKPSDPAASSSSSCEYNVDYLFDLSQADDS